MDIVVIIPLSSYTYYWTTYISNSCGCDERENTDIICCGLSLLPCDNNNNNNSEGEEPCARADEMEYYYEVMDFYEVIWRL